ncbi:MAG: 2-dehydropantoate 2-reductase [Chloroflexota bacterium]
MNILIFGAGAIGTYIGGSLLLSGHQAVFIEQQGVVDVLRQRGLRLDLTVDKRRNQTDAFLIDPSGYRCVPSLAEALRHGPFDLAVFALKSFDTAAALEGMKPHRDQMPPLLCLQNGVDNEPAIAALLGPDRVIAGTVTSSIGRLAAGDIVLERQRGVGIAGGHPLSDSLAAACGDAWLNPRLYPRAADMKWSKMLTNLVGNASAAILNMTPREVFAHPGLFSLEMAMMSEALAVMEALGVKVVDLPGTPVRALALATRLPAFISKPLLVKAVGGGRGGKMPSFHIDLHSGRGRSEVDWLNGAVVQQGELTGVPTPVNRLLTTTLLALTRDERAIREYDHQAQKLLIDLM